MKTRVVCSLCPVVLAVAAPFSWAQTSRGSAAVAQLRYSPFGNMNLTAAQRAAVEALLQLNDQERAVAVARQALAEIAFSAPPDERAIHAKVDALASAELALAMARANTFGTIQSSVTKLSREQVAAVVAVVTAQPGATGAGMVPVYWRRTPAMAPGTPGTFAPPKEVSVRTGLSK